MTNPITTPTGAAAPGPLKPNEVYRDLPCGCEVIGHGTIPDPLTVRQCPTCASAPAMRDALEVLDTFANELERAGVVLKDWRLPVATYGEWGTLQLRGEHLLAARAALAASRGEVKP